jgi:voltage-gated potassium channel
VAILLSVTVVILDSEDDLHARYGGRVLRDRVGLHPAVHREYALRLMLVRGRCATRAASSGSSTWCRSCRPTCRCCSRQPAPADRAGAARAALFRILKLVQYSSEAGVLLGALLRSRYKILVFLYTMLTIVLIFGALMYVVEGPEQRLHQHSHRHVLGDRDRGDGRLRRHRPVTPFGRFIASVLVLIGYSIIAVPTGIYTAELAKTMRRSAAACAARNAGCLDHEVDAWHCRQCGRGLPDAEEPAAA